MLVANSNTHLGQTQLSYQLAVSGLSTESQQVRVSWSTINAATTEFTFVQSSLVSVGNGTLFYQLESSVPAVDFLQIELGLP